MNYTTETYTENDKKHIKRLYEIIKVVLKEYDIQMKYAHSHSCADNSKILIQPQNTIIVYGNKPLYINNVTLHSRKIWYKNNDIIYFVLLQPRKNKIYQYYEKELNIMYILEHYINDNNINFELKNDLDKDMINNKLQSKTFGKSKKTIYIINNIPVQIQVYKTSDISIYKMNNDNTYTKKETITQYRPYQIKINKQTYELTNRIIEYVDVRNNDFKKPYLQELKIHYHYMDLNLINT